MSLLTTIDSIIDKFDASSTNPQTDDKKADDILDRTDSLSISCTMRQLPGWSYSFLVSDILHSQKSKFQDIKVVDTPIFDRCLLIDGQIQSSVKDEFIYHESLVHPAMMSHPNPVSVFIGGGGECATAREILKYKSVKKLVVCDLDRDVIDVSKKHLPSMYGADDKRCKIMIMDAVQYMKQCNSVFDVIIMDICDPIEAGPGLVCYFKEFYDLCKSKLTRNGILVTQSTGCGLLLYHECFTVIVNTVQSVYDDVLPYSAYVPSFYSQWGYTMAFKGNRPKWFLDAECVDKELEKKLGKEGVDSLRYYDGETHLKMFHLPKYLRTALAKETRIMTKETPVYCL